MRFRLSGLTPSISARCTRLATTVSAVLSVVSTCCETVSARLSVTTLALRRLASRACQICQLSMPTRAADRQRANAIVQLSQDARKDAGRGDAGRVMDRRLMTRESYAGRLTLDLTRPHGIPPSATICLR